MLGGGFDMSPVASMGSMSYLNNLLSGDEFDWKQMLHSMAIPPGLYPQGLADAGALPDGAIAPEGDPANTLAGAFGGGRKPIPQAQPYYYYS